MEIGKLRRTRDLVPYRTGGTPALPGRDAALRRHRPCSSGRNSIPGAASAFLVAPLYAARTAQRAVPTDRVWMDRQRPFPDLGLVTSSPTVPVEACLSRVFLTTTWRATHWGTVPPAALGAKCHLVRLAGRRSLSGVLAGFAGRVYLGRRRPHFRQSDAAIGAGALGHLVQAGSDLPILSIEFHRFLGGLPSLGIKSAGLSPAESGAARAGGGIAVAGIEATGGARRVAGGSHFCA